MKGGEHRRTVISHHALTGSGALIIAALGSGSLWVMGADIDACCNKSSAVGPIRSTCTPALKRGRVRPRLHNHDQHQIFGGNDRNGNHVICELNHAACVHW